MASGKESACQCLQPVLAHTSLTGAILCFARHFPEATASHHPGRWESKKIPGRKENPTGGLPVQKASLSSTAGSLWVKEPPGAAVMGGLYCPELILLVANRGAVQFHGSQPAVRNQTTWSPARRGHLWLLHRTWVKRTKRQHTFISLWLILPPNKGRNKCLN